MLIVGFTLESPKKVRFKVYAKVTKLLILLNFLFKIKVTELLIAKLKNYSNERCKLAITMCLKVQSRV